MSNTPVRLYKKEESISERIDAWTLAHAHILLPILVFVGIILIIILACTIVGFSATESGLQYNHLKDVI